MNACGLVILNGSDGVASHTCQNYMGSSVIDYIIISHYNIIFILLQQAYFYLSLSACLTINDIVYCFTDRFTFSNFFYCINAVLIS